MYSHDYFDSDTERRAARWTALTHVMVVFFLSVLEEGLEGLVGAEDLVAVGVRAVRTRGRVLEQNAAGSGQRALLQTGRRLSDTQVTRSARGGTGHQIRSGRHRSPGQLGGNKGHQVSSGRHRPPGQIGGTGHQVSSGEGQVTRSAQGRTGRQVSSGRDRSPGQLGEGQITRSARGRDRSLGQLGGGQVTRSARGDTGHQVSSG